MPIERQVSFAAGELSPRLWGRTDLPQYRQGARTMKNILVTPDGVAQVRPGTQLVYNVGEDSSLDDRLTKMRMFPFVYAQDDTCLLLFGDSEVEVSDAHMEADPRHEFRKIGAFPSPYPAQKVAGLRFSQIGNEILITHDEYKPRVLRRLNNDNTQWVFETISFTRLFGNVVTTRLGYLDLSNENTSVDYTLPSDDSHPPREWSWRITLVVRQDLTGRVFETGSFLVTQFKDENNQFTTIVAPATGAAFPIYPDRPRRLFLEFKDGDQLIGTFAQGHTYTVMGSNVYRGRDGEYGLLGFARGNYFVDYGSTPDTSNPPPSGFSPFDIYQAEALLRTENPRLGAHFQGRRIFAATAERPGFIWGSSVDDFTNFDEVIPPDDADSLSFEIISNEAERIQGVVPGPFMFVLTAGGEYIVGGSGENASVVSPNSLSARRVGHRGCADSPAPTQADDWVFFCNRAGLPVAARVRADGGYEVIDVWMHARHLFEGYEILDWDWSKSHKTLWCARSDGTVLALTFNPDLGVIAWSRHEIADGGKVQSVAIKPEYREDGVYLLVRREVRAAGAGVSPLSSKDTYHVERFAYRNVRSQKQSIHMDRTVSHNGQWRKPEDGTVPGLKHGFHFNDETMEGGAEGKTIQVQFGPGEGSEDSKVGMVIQVDNTEGGPPVQVLLTARDAGGDHYDGQVLDQAIPASMLNVFFSAHDWYECVDAVSSAVITEPSGGWSATRVPVTRTANTIVADGIVSTIVVFGGSGADLGGFAGVAHVGVRFNADIEMLDAMEDRGFEKIVEKAEIELDFARGGQAGVDLDNLFDLRTREVGDAYGVELPKTDTYRVRLEGEWGRKGRVAFRQNLPLPTTLVGVTRHIQRGGT